METGYRAYGDELIRLPAGYIDLPEPALAAGSGFVNAFLSPTANLIEGEWIYA